MADNIEIADEVHDRYHRLKLIKWWDQAKLKKARVMVIGAGALGNEILKNLALLGIGRIYIVDFDLIENSNLSRSILFREKDEGLKKAEVAAERVKDINPEIKTAWFHGDLNCELGMGVFRRMDVVIGGLDNMEARRTINDACWRFKIPYIDGGTHTLQGQVRAFTPPAGPCYECTLSPEDYKRMLERVHCNLLTRAEMLEGKVSTTPIASSIIAAVEVQMAVEILHGREVPSGKTVVYNGELSGGEYEMYMASYGIKNTDWHQHSQMECAPEVVLLQEKARELTARKALEIVRERIGKDAGIDLPHNFVLDFTCRNCGSSTRTMKLLAKCREKDAKCPGCGQVRDYNLLYSITGEEDFLDLPMAQLGVAPLDIFFGRSKNTMCYFELAGDLQDVLGPLIGD